MSFLVHPKAIRKLSYLHVLIHKSGTCTCSLKLYYVSHGYCLDNISHTQCTQHLGREMANTAGWSKPVNEGHSP